MSFLTRFLRSRLLRTGFLAVFLSASLCLAVTHNPKGTENDKNASDIWIQSVQASLNTNNNTITVTVTLGEKMKGDGSGSALGREAAEVEIYAQGKSKPVWKATPKEGSGNKIYELKNSNVDACVIDVKAYGKVSGEKTGPDIKNDVRVKASGSVGSGGGGNNSIDVSYELGFDSYGNGGANVYLEVNRPDANLYTPAILQVGGTASVLRDAAGMITYMETGEAFITVNVLTSDSYSLEFRSKPSNNLIKAVTFSNPGYTVINNTGDPVLFYTSRWGRDFSYAIPVPDGPVNVQLDFAELFHDTSGKARFNVKLEGNTALSNYDVFAQAGARNTAKTQNISGIVLDGELNLDFHATNYGAQVSAIKVIRSEITVIGSTGDSATVYQSERFGNFNYDISLENGDYQVTLYFVEKSHSATGQRVFDVSAEGTVVLDNYDIYQQAGAANTAKTETFSVTVVDGGLNLGFTGVTGDASICAIAVRPLTTNASTGNIEVGDVVWAVNAGSASDYEMPDGTLFASDTDYTGGEMDYPGLPLVAINAGGGAYIDSTGTQYIADTYFTGGREYLGGQNRLLVTDAPPSGQTVTYDYSFTVVPHSGEFGECLLAYAGGLKKEGKETVWSLDQLSYTEIRTLRNASDQLVSKTATTWEKFPFGFRKVSEVLDPDGAALATTWDYIEGSENPADPKPAGYGEIKSMNRYDGYWEVYTYNGDGVLIKTVSRYLNSTTRSEADNKVETFAYSTSNPILTHVVSIQGQEVTRSYEAEFDDWNEFEHWTIIAVTPDALWDAPENLVSKTRTYHSSHPTEFLRGRIKWIQSPDGTMTFYSYSINGSNRTITRDVGAPNANKTAIVDGIRTITEINEVGQQVDEELVDIASGLTLSTITALEVDSLGRPTLIGYGDGTARSIIYAGSSASCGSCSGPGTWQIAQEIDRYGITTTYTYDALGRRIGTVRLGISEQIIYDAVDHVIQRTRIGSDGSETIREQVTFDMAGREATRKDALGNEITIIYAYPSEGGAVTTTTNPITAAGEGTRIETAYADGKLKEIGGTAVSPLRYVYGTWTTSGQAGEWTQEIKVGDNNAETEWIKTYSDLTGRQIKIEYPDGDGSYAALSYNTQGHLVGQTDPDGLTTLFAYNAKGKREVTAIDMNQDGVIDYAGADRITKTTNDVYSKSGTIVNRIITQVWATDNSNTPTTLSIVEQDAYGNESWQTNAAGAVTHNQTVLNGNGNWSVTMTSPDGSQQMQSYSNGRLAYSTQKASTGAQVTRTDYAYDAHNRVITQTDARTGPVTQTYSDRDEVLSVTSNNGTNTTSYTYDALGNRLTVTHPDNSVTINEYHLRNNLLKKIFGSQAYPIEYTYDLQGRMKTLTTWRNATTAAGAAVTTWNYDSQRGWLTQKLYADNTGPSYTYTPAGKLATRIWARTVNGSPLDTSYDYNNAGDLILIDYSDSTPDVTIAYNRFGAQATVTDATGLRTVTYNAALQLEQEKLPGFFGNRILTRSHEIAGTGSIPGREAGFLLGTISDLDSDHAVIYGYDNAGRLNTVTDLDATYTYGYLPNSNLRATITGPAHTVTYSYEPHRDVVTSIENKVGAVTVSKYDYTVNSLGQRTQRQQSGTAFTATSTDIFVYNGKGEVTDSSNTIFPDYNRNFIYDDIGNRTSFTNNTGTFSYTTNNLNQYSGIQSLGSQFIASDYDLDGNMTIVGTGFRYVWDAENRLVVVEPVAPFVGDKKQRNTYDSQGRRVRKEVLSYNGSTWSLNTDEKFIYDGWNLVAVLDATNSNALLRTHTWGLDLSGTLQGAGGVGGLLAVKERSGLYSSVKHFTLDVNGNVSEVLNDSGTVVAHYEYDVFGDTVVSSGAYKDNNLWRFNSKYLDNLGGIYYYGYRFYAPAIGRWLNRDIISERGGTNLYAMVSNGTINQYDILGMIRNWTYNSAISEVQGTISSWSSIYPFASRLMAHWLRENRKSQGLSMPILPYITSSNDENEVKQYGMSAIKAEINAEMDRVRVPNGGTLYFADRNVNYTFTGGNMGFSYGNVQLTIYASGILIGARQNNFGTISVPYEGDFIIKLDDTYAWRTDLRGILTSAWSATYDAASWLTQNCAYKQFSHSMSFQQHIKDIYIEMSSL